MMKRILVRGLIVMVMAIAGFAAIVAMQPADYRVERSAVVAVPPAEVFAQVNDLHNWENWSPWAKLDPNATGSYEGPPAGEGAVFRWAGNADVGEGSMTILESVPDELIRIKLHFIKPFEDIATTEFTFTPRGSGEDEQTTVRWTMFGRNEFIGKAVCLFMNMDELIGSDFEEGLSNIKSIVEADPAIEH